MNLLFATARNCFSLPSKYVSAACSIRPNKFGDISTMQESDRIHQLQSERSSMLLSAALENANLAIKSTMLINGGAAIAILAFIGQMNDNEDKELELVISLTRSLILFAIGAGFSTAAIIFGYFSNYSYFESSQYMSASHEYPYLQTNVSSKKWRKIAISFHTIGIFCVITSISLFIYGVYLVGHSII